MSNELSKRAPGKKLATKKKKTNAGKKATDKNQWLPLGLFINEATGELWPDQRAQAREKINLVTATAYKSKMMSGVKFPAIIVYYDAAKGKYWLADGFHRVLSAFRAEFDKIKAEVRPGTLRDAIAYAVSANESHGLPRRNVDKERAIRLVLLDPEWSQESDHWIAKFTGTSHPTVGKIRRMLKGDTSEPRTKTVTVRRGGQVYEQTIETPAGKIATTRAADDPSQILQLSRLPVEQHYEAAALLHSGAAKNMAQVNRVMHRRTLKIAAWPQGKYRVIVADPAWKLDNAGMFAAENQYPCMELDDICALPVESLATDDSVLFLWVPETLLISHAPKVLEAWGFTHKAGFVWDKEASNEGYYNQVEHEHLLICTRGSALPEGGEKFKSVQHIKRTSDFRHSEKPKEFFDIIDTMYPYGPRIELNSREARDGWDHWGNEVEGAEQPDLEAPTAEDNEQPESSADAALAPNVSELPDDFTSMPLTLLTVEDAQNQLDLWEGQLMRIDQHITIAQTPGSILMHELDEYHQIQTKVLMQIEQIRARMAELEEQERIAGMQRLIAETEAQSEPMQLPLPKTGAKAKPVPVPKKGTKKTAASVK